MKHLAKFDFQKLDLFIRVKFRPFFMFGTNDAGLVTSLVIVPMYEWNH